MKPVGIGPLSIGGGRPLLFIAGPCVIESAAHAMDLALALREIAVRTGVPLVYKASYDKANRTSGSSFRGPGLEAGLEVLTDIGASDLGPLTSSLVPPRRLESVQVNRERKDDRSPFDPMLANTNISRISRPKLAINNTQPSNRW